jgi:5'-3' exonuclease
VPVGAVYGYTTMLWRLAEDLHKADGPTHLAVILDKGSITFRNDLYDQYKANRPPPPGDEAAVPADPRCHARVQPGPASRKKAWKPTT